MNTYFIFVAICLALVQCEDSIEYESNEYEAFEYEDDIERLGPQMRIPNKDTIQALVDTTLDGLRDKGFNNYTFDSFELPIDSEELGISANIKATGSLKGLLDCNVIVSGALFSWKFKINWNEPIEVNIEPYDLQGFVHMIKVFGKGKLSLKLEDVIIDLAIVLKVWPGDKNAVAVRTFTLKNMSFQHHLELTGWLNDEVRSALISKFVNDNLHSIIEVYDKEIKTTINNFATEKLKTIKIPIG